MEIDETSLTPLFIQVAQWLEEEILKVLGNIWKIDDLTILWMFFVQIL